MPKLTRRQLIILTLGGFLSYLLFGMFDSMRGATLSVLLTDLDLSYTAGGSVVMGQYAGYFAATLLVGILADRTGPKFTLVLAACSLIFGVAGYAASSGLPALIAFIFFIGIGLGSLELGGCNIIAAIYKEKKGRYLNILAAIAGCGAFVTPMIAGLFLDQGRFLAVNLPVRTADRRPGCRIFRPSALAAPPSDMPEMRKKLPPLPPAPSGRAQPLPDIRAGPEAWPYYP